MKNIILTGIERSGSSYAVDVLNNYSNVVFLNEPPLEYLPSQPERILEYFEQYRRRILSGFPVQGVFKAETNELAHDMLGSVRGQVESRPYIATYDDSEFILGFKSLTPMLRHTYYFRQFPSLGIKYIAIVRHPVDTIFSQLKNGGANLPVIPNAGPEIAMIIDKIASMQNPLERAAYVWRFNTSMILDNLDMYEILRYNSLCRHSAPLAIMALGLGAGEKLREIPKSDPIRHKDKFSVEGRAIIAKICRNNALELGVWD